MMTTEFKMPEPVAIVESWTNGSYGRSYRLDWQGQAEAGEALYTSSHMRAVIEQCAKLAACAGSGSAEVAGLDAQDYIAEEIRKILEQLK